MSSWSVLTLWAGGLHHRHDPGADRLGQLGPGGHNRGQVGAPEGFSSSGLDVLLAYWLSGNASFSTRASRTPA